MGEGGEEPSEAELATRSRSGDRAAFEMLVRRTGRWVFARLYLQTGDAHRAEDLTQETFLTAWKCIGELVDPAAVRGWLAAIARRTLLDAAKHETRKKRKGLCVGIERLIALRHPDPSPPAVTEANEERQRALEMLRKLPEEYQMPLMLRYIGGADYETISRQLALSNGSLRGLLQRGLAMLREQMKSS